MHSQERPLIERLNSFTEVNISVNQYLSPQNLRRGLIDQTEAILLKIEAALRIKELDSTYDLLPKLREIRSEVKSPRSYFSVNDKNALLNLLRLLENDSNEFQKIKNSIYEYTLRPIDMENANIFEMYRHHKNSKKISRLDFQRLGFHQINNSRMTMRLLQIGISDSRISNWVAEDRTENIFTKEIVEQIAQNNSTVQPQWWNNLNEQSPNSTNSLSSRTQIPSSISTLSSSQVNTPDFQVEKLQSKTNISISLGTAKSSYNFSDSMRPILSSRSSRLIVETSQ